MGNYIVLDLEWNQASTKEKEVKKLMFEILEIGAVKVSEDGRILDIFSSMIRPQVYKTLHYMTKKIVHFDIKDLASEPVFPTVMKNFLKWCGPDPIFCTWGTSDMTELQRNMAYYHMKPLSEGPLMYLDVQKLFSLDFEDGKKRRSLESAVEFFEMEQKEEFHSALSDAKYTADIFTRIVGSEVMAYHSYDNFYLPRDKAGEIHVKFPTYTKYISRIFKNKNVAIADREVSSLKCSVCNKNTKRIIRWFSPNGGRFYLCIGDCPEHGYIKAKSRMKKLEGEQVYVVKTVKPVSDEIADDIKERYGKAKKKTELYLKSQKSKSSNSDL